LTRQFANIAKEYPYFEVAGTASADTLESNGRVKFADRERKAFIRAVQDVRSSLKGRQDVESQQILEGLEIYQRNEEALQNRFGKEGQKAQQLIETIKSNLNKSKNYNANLPGRKRVVIGAGDEYGLIDDNTYRLNINDLKGEFEYDKLKGGYDPEIYKNSAMSQIRNLGKEWEKADFVFDVNSFASALNLVIPQEYQRMLLTDIGITSNKNGYITPSAPEKALNRAIVAIKE